MQKAILLLCLSLLLTACGAAAPAETAAPAAATTAPPQTQMPTTAPETTAAPTTVPETTVAETLPPETTVPLEAAFEEYLHGVDGIRIDTVTSSGELVKSEYSVEPKAGSNVEISIDINHQRAAEEGLASVIESLRASQEKDADGKDAEGGAVVAMDVKTGQVLVCASYPSYDPSTYFEDYAEILEADYDPLYNRALLGAYPPGSTYKMSMVVAGIDSGVINSTTEIYDKGVYDKYAPGFIVKCLRFTNYCMIHKHLNAAEALQVSCNYFFYDLGDRISLAAMDNTAKALGLGEPTGIELPENTGRRANAETKKKLYSGDNSGWYKADQITAAIGQSDNRFTPMQLCVYTSALANRGTRYKATFLNRVVSSDYRNLLAESKREVLSTLQISDDAYSAYSTGMKLVTQKTADWNGTAYSTFKNYPISVAAKTGTAQDKSGASDNGAFVCYAPADDPQIAIAIYGEKAGHGNTLATIARDILDIYFDVGEIGDVITYENKLS
jgi:penicillin-binding protein 2